MPVRLFLVYRLSGTMDRLFTEDYVRILCGVFFVAEISPQGASANGIMMVRYRNMTTKIGEKRR